jgi:hypothetical protein
MGVSLRGEAPPEIQVWCRLPGLFILDRRFVTAETRPGSAPLEQGLREGFTAFRPHWVVDLRASRPVDG